MPLIPATPLWTADEGKTIKVKVSFTDDEDNDEASDQCCNFESVAAKTQQSRLRESPTISGTARGGSDADG